MISHKVNEDELQEAIFHSYHLHSTPDYLQDLHGGQRKAKGVRICSNMLAMQKIRKRILNNSNNNHQQVMYSHHNHEFTYTNSYAMWQHLDSICMWYQLNNGSSYKPGPNIWTPNPLIWAPSPLSELGTNHKSPHLNLWLTSFTITTTYDIWHTIMQRQQHNNDYSPTSDCKQSFVTRTNDDYNPTYDCKKSCI